MQSGMTNIVRAAIRALPDCYYNLNYTSLIPSDATGLSHFNIKFFRFQHQISGINIDKRYKSVSCLFKTFFV